MYASLCKVLWIETTTTSLALPLHRVFWESTMYYIVIPSFTIFHRMKSDHLESAPGLE